MVSEERSPTAIAWEDVWNDIWAQQGFVFSRLVHGGREAYNMILRRLLLQYLTPASRVLELGCGTATLTLSLAPRIASLVGIDISDNALQLARSAQVHLQARNAEFLKADCRAVPFTDAFDLVWSAGLIEHFFDADIEIVRQHLKATKPGGVTLLSVPYAYSLHRLHYVLTRPALTRRFWPWSDVRHFQRFYAHADLHRLARRIGQPYRVFLLPPVWAGLFVGIIMLEIRKTP